MVTAACNWRHSSTAKRVYPVQLYGWRQELSRWFVGEGPMSDKKQAEGITTAQLSSRVRTQVDELLPHGPSHATALTCVS